MATPEQRNRFRTLAPRLLVGVAVALVFLSLAPAAEAQMSTGRGRLSGIVMDPEGNPIEGALVTLTHIDTGDSWELTTDSNGRWNKGAMGGGMWNIDISAEGYLPSAVSADVSEYQRMKPVQVNLTPGEAPSTTAASSSSAFSEKLVNALEPANALYTAQDFAGALAAYESILAQMPGEKNIHIVEVSAGNAAFEKGDYGAAQAHFEAALAVDPDLPEARMGLAKIHMMQRDLDGALAELEKIDLASISDAIVFYNIGNLLFEQGQSSESAKYYQLALDRNPNFADAHMQMGLALIQQGMFVEAKPHLQKVVELDPESQNAALAQQFLDMPDMQDGSGS